MARLATRPVKRRTLVLRRAAAVSIALLAAFAAMPAFAAKVYRCGNAFQDQPCPEVRIAAALPAERTPPVARDTPCATRDGRPDCVAKTAAPRDLPTDVKR